MCIMEVHAGQLTGTMVQACAHNCSTVDRDLDMLIRLMESRGAVTLSSVTQAQELIHTGYAILLDVFGEETASISADVAGHVHDHDHGNERSFVEQAHHDAGLARKYETR